MDLFICHDPPICVFCHFGPPEHVSPNMTPPAFGNLRLFPRGISTTNHLVAIRPEVIGPTGNILGVRRGGEPSNAISMYMHRESREDEKRT